MKKNTIIPYYYVITEFLNISKFFSTYRQTENV